MKDVLKHFYNLKMQNIKLFKVLKNQLTDENTLKNSGWTVYLHEVRSDLMIVYFSHKGLGLRYRSAIKNIVGIEQVKEFLRNASKA